MARLVDRIRIREEQPLAARKFGSGPNRIGLAGPAFLKRRRLHDGHSSKLGGNGRGSVRRSVVDHKYFPIPLQLPSILRLVDQRAQAVSEAILFVAGGDDDGKLER
jgi:hypothetical protein